MIGWLLFAVLIGFIAGSSLVAYFAWRWYSMQPERVVMGRTLKSKVIDSTHYDEGDGE